MRAANAKAGPSHANLARIFPEGDIATSMQPIFDAPMGLLQGEQARGVGLLPGQIGQAINRLLALFCSVSDISSQAKGYCYWKWWIIPIPPPERISARFCASSTSLLICLRAHMVHRHPTRHLSGGRTDTLPSSGSDKCLQWQRQPQQFLHGPASRSEPCRHGRGSLPVPSGKTVPPSFQWRW